MTPQTVHRRPRAATVLGWLLIAQGFLALAIFGVLLAALLAAQPAPPALAPTAQLEPAATAQPVATPDELGAAPQPPARGPVLLSAGAGLAGAFGLVSGVGLLRLQGWAWLLALITQGVVLLVALIDYWIGSPDYLSLALGVVQVYLLNRSDVQQAIRRASPHAAEALPSPPAAPAPEHSA